MRKVDRRAVEYPDYLKSREVINSLEEIKKHFELDEDDRSYRRVSFLHSRHPSFHKYLYKTLSDLFANKCAYCEIQIEPDLAEINCFRPREAASSLRLDDVSFDHYVWFAYEWNNLFLCCKRCSNSKRNIFPVSGPRAPVLCAWDEACLLEKNTILNPCEDNPAKHLKIKLDGNFVRKSIRGHLTIKVLDLNDEYLVAKRKVKLETCLRILFSLQINDERDGATEALSKELSDKSEFSGVAELFLLDLLKSIAGKLGLPTPRAFDVEAYLSIVGSTFKRERDFFDFANEVNNSESSIERSVEYSSQKSVLDNDVRQETARSLVRKITISNFKGIENLEFSVLPSKNIEGDKVPCLMILGENATGKSTVLQAVALCLMGPHNRDKLNININDYLPRDKDGWKHQLTKVPYVEIIFEDGRTSVLKIDPFEKTFDGDATQSSVLLSFGARRYFNAAKSKYYKKERYESLFDPLSTSSHPKFWLASVDDQTFTSIARALTEIFVLSEHDKIVRKADGHIYISAHGRETPIERLSEGYKSIFSLVMNVARAMIEQWGVLEEARGVVLIDEIDIHLHPRWKIRVVDALRTAFPKIQFITTTHDPLCLRGFSKDEIRVLYRSDDYEIKSLETLPDTTSLRIEQLLTSDLFGLATTEDRSVEEYFNQLAFDNVDLRESTSRLEVIDDLRKKNKPDILIGDTPAEQIKNEAIKRFVQQRNTLDAASRSRLKEQAILDVLEALKNKSGNQQ